MRVVSADLPYLDEMTAGLKKHFDLDSFRNSQAEVVSSVLSGRNTVVVMPTGAGKSLCYQLPAMLLDGVALVISPLIALMQDQVQALEAKGISATFINSTLSEAERQDRQRRLRQGEYKLVYVAPERLRSEAFLSALTEAKVSLYAIDEAHCISQWGHDFRPDYALLGQIRKRLRPPRTVALTATATPEVRDDIARILLLKEPQIFVAGFDRPNLFLEVTTVTGDAEKRAAVEVLAEEGSGIVYCNTRKQAEAMHEHLQSQEIETVLYHAGMEDEARRRAQDEFMASDACVAVATNAFGMGIDKPDIRFVAHAGIPRAVEAYYQEIGRAGRDGKPGHAVLLFNHADVFTQERLIQSNHPPETLFADVWNVLRPLESFERGVHALANQVGTSEFEISAVLKFLEREGLISRGGRGEGRYGVTLLESCRKHQPRNADTRGLLTSLMANFEVGVRTTTDLSILARRAGLGLEDTVHALTLLEKAKVLLLNKPFAGKAITPLKSESWRELGLNFDRLRAMERNQTLLLKRMTDYAYSKRCRRAFMLRYFGEETPIGQSCGSCDVCVGAKVKIKPSAAVSRYAVDKVVPLPGKFSALAAEQLKKWRRELAQDVGMPPFMIFNDATLYGIAAVLPVNEREFMSVKGTGAARWERFGARIVEICRVARASGDIPTPVAAVAAKRKRR